MISPNFLARVFRVGLGHQESVAPAPSTFLNQEATRHYMSEPRYYTRALLESPGVHPLSCEVNGSRHNRERFPVLPTDHVSLYSSIIDGQNPVPDTQAQSPFFAQLPTEIRQLIYRQLFGDRRVHLDLDYVSQQAQWLWWHRVCDCPDTRPDKQFICPENAAAETMMLHLGSKAWVTGRAEAKVDGVGWLRCCKKGYEEALAVLYSTNSFVLNYGIDQIFRVSRAMPQDHLALLTSLVIEINLYRISRSFPSMSTKFAGYYREFFRILKEMMSGLRSLSITIAGLPRSTALIEWSLEDEEMWIGPWEYLARSRRWAILQIAVPAGWYDDFKAVIDRRGQLDDDGRFSLIKREESFRRGW
ncbi:hypothetical protein BJY00DRAFT_306904 [Aspergillus carlsbadensis]|nr:hypothetical protein BJY00DRAFT_306904 [Aspergillus carlsbadensis]